MHTFMMDVDVTDWEEYGWLSTADLKAAIEKIEKAELAFVESGGQQTTSIGGVSITWTRREQITQKKNDLIALLKKRLGREGYAPYKLTHLMR